MEVLSENEIILRVAQACKKANVKLSQSRANLYMRCLEIARANGQRDEEENLMLVFTTKELSNLTDIPVSTILAAIPAFEKAGLIHRNNMFNGMASIPLKNIRRTCGRPPKLASIIFSKEIFKAN